MLHKVYKVLYNSCLSFLLSLLKSLQLVALNLGEECSCAHWVTRLKTRDFHVEMDSRLPGKVHRSRSTSHQPEQSQLSFLN